MNKVWILVYVLATVFVHATTQKMILSANIQTQEAAKDLYNIEKFFQENSTAKALQSKHKLHIQMELLDKHVLVTIKPIRDLLVKNQLNYLLKAQYPKSFVVDDSPFVSETSSPSPQVPKKTEALQKPALTTTVTKKEEVLVRMKEVKVSTSLLDEIKLFWKHLDSEWLGLIFLALAGFLLIYRSNRQISKIRALQKEVEVYQSKIENDIEGIGVHR